MMRLALGTAQFGLKYGIANTVGQASRATAISMLGLAFKSGIDTLDTAISYGDSENRLGEIGVHDFRLITKLPSIPRGVENIAEWIAAHLQSSLDRLGEKNIHALLLHRPEQLLSDRGQEIFNVLCSIRDAGLVKKIGISVYSPSDLDNLVPKFRFDLVQLPLNVLDRRFESSEWLRKLKDQDVEIHTRSAFLQGLLLMPRAQIPDKFRQWNSLWDEWEQWLASSNMSAVKASLAYPLSISEIDRIVVGAETLDQLEQLISTAHESPGAIVDINCEDEKLINPANWAPS